MAREFNRNPWEHTDEYIDRTYPSGVAGARPKLTTRIRCEPDSEPLESGSESDDRIAEFNRRLRAGHGTGER
jgi:hypothetical protein